jgi:hypothetical protein
MINSKFKALHMKKALLLLVGLSMSFWATAQMRNVTFQVDMNNYTGTFTTPELNGTFNNWCGNCAAMADPNNDNIWTITIPLNQGSTVEFKFSHDNWGGQEMLPPSGSCTNGNTQFTNRVLVVPANDTVLPVVCWGSCGPCAGQPTTANITFRVDMNDFTGTFTRPEINGTFNNWCGNCAGMNDANTDDIWDITINLPIGDTIEYKFSHDNWAGQETNDPTGPCTNGNAQFTNRVLVIRGDTTMPAVCWGSCLPCGQSSSVEELNAPSLAVYPNPASGNVRVSSTQAGTVRLLDLTGRVVREEKMEAGELTLTLEGLNAGLYLVQLNGAYRSASQRLLVK